LHSNRKYHLLLVSGNHHYAYGLRHPGWSSPPLAASDARYAFAGGTRTADELDVQWQRNGARMYDPVLGRFLGVEPLADVYVSLSVYAYAANDPVNLVDPSGYNATHSDNLVNPGFPADTWELIVQGYRSAESGGRNKFTVDVYYDEYGNYIGASLHTGRVGMIYIIAELSSVSTLLTPAGNVDTEAAIQNGRELLSKAYRSGRVGINALERMFTHIFRGIEFAPVKRSGSGIAETPKGEQMLIGMKGNKIRVGTTYDPIDGWGETFKEGIMLEINRVLDGNFDNIANVVSTLVHEAFHWFTQDEHIIWGKEPNEITGLTRGQDDASSHMQAFQYELTHPAFEFTSTDYRNSTSAILSKVFNDILNDDLWIRNGRMYTPDNFDVKAQRVQNHFRPIFNPILARYGLPTL